MELGKKRKNPDLPTGLFFAQSVSMLQREMPPGITAYQPRECLQALAGVKGLSKRKPQLQTLYIVQQRPQMSLGAIRELTSEEVFKGKKKK